MTHLKTVHHSHQQPAGDVIAQIRSALEAGIADCRAEVSGGGGHYTIDVVAPVFEGKSRLESQRLVLRAIKHLMEGTAAPVHAVDSIVTRAR